MHIQSGAVKDVKDLRDYPYDHISFGSAPFDWEKGYDVESLLGFKIPPENQNGSWSCVGQATAKYAYVLNAFELYPIYYSELQKFLPKLSAKSVYSQISLGHSQGARLRDAAKLLVNYGVNTEVDVPSYSGGLPPTEDFMISKEWFTPRMQDKAQNYRGLEYRTIVAKHSIDMMAQAIRDGKGMLMGFGGSNNGSWSSKFPEYSRNIQWYHCVYAGKAKMINGKKYIGFLDSRGDVGENGWLWFGEEWFLNDAVFNPWVVIDRQNIDWINFVDRNGQPRKFPVYFIKAFRYMIEKQGSKFV